MARKLNFRDTRLIYLMIFLVMFYASIAPMTLPLPTLKWVSDFYNTLEKGGTVSFATPARTFGPIKEGSRVFIQFGGETSSLWGDMSEGTYDVFNYLVQKHAHLLIWASTATLANLLEVYVFPKIYGGPPNTWSLYGKEVVYLGFVAGADALIEQYRFSVKAITPRDAYGASLTSLEMMQNFDALKSDADLIVGFDARAVDSAYVIRDNNLVLLLGGTDSASYLAYYYTAGFVKGCIYGQNQAAQFEILSGIQGKAMSYAENTLFLAIIMVVVITSSNVMYRWKLRKTGEQTKIQTGGTT